jgi:hypothetical protein
MIIDIKTRNLVKEQGQAIEQLVNMGFKFDYYDTPYYLEIEIKAKLNITVVSIVVGKYFAQVVQNSSYKSLQKFSYEDNDWVFNLTNYVHDLMIFLDISLIH